MLKDRSRFRQFLWPFPARPLGTCFWVLFTGFLWAGLLFPVTVGPYLLLDYLLTPLTGQWLPVLIYFGLFLLVTYGRTR